MIHRLRHVNREQWKLLASLSTGFMTRIPGALGVLWFLPLIRYGLGTDAYAQLLSAMALGTATGFLSGGFNFVGRRMVGEAYANDDRAAEADAFASMFVAHMTSLLLIIVTVAVYCWASHAGSDIFVIAVATGALQVLGQFDDIRAAYNEYYISAITVIIVQSLSYLIGFLILAIRHDMVLSALVIVAPYIVSSTISGALLLYQRPYLLRGSPIAIWLVLRRGIMLAMADGFIMTVMSLSVVWLQTSATSTTAAWYGTVVRLFQIFLMPVVLLLFPLSSYIRMRWHHKSASQQQAFTKLTLLVGIGYGAVVSVALFVVSSLYVGMLLHLPLPKNMLVISPIFLLFGAIIAYKTYSQIAYVVLDEAVHLSSWTTIAITTGVVLGAAASLVVEPMGAIGIYALVVGLATIIILTWNTVRSVRSIALQAINQSRRVTSIAPQQQPNVSA